MKKIFFFFVLAIAYEMNAQQFINAGKIEYEVRINNHKLAGDDGIWADVAKKNFPQFSVSYYNLVFSGDKAVYKFDRQVEKTKLSITFNNNIEDNIWYSDYSSETYTNSKFILDDTYLLSGALMNIEWKMVPNETREIAGFNCRKAYGVIFDSVYVFAFYTDEITVSGGPMGIRGLPGMVLGITIPRMFGSWIATKLELTADVKQVTPPQKGKKKDPSELKATIEKATKSWGTTGQQAVWNYFL